MNLLHDLVIVDAIVARKGQLSIQLNILAEKLEANEKAHESMSKEYKSTLDAYDKLTQFLEELNATE